MHKTPRYYLGIDAGATKTHALIAGQDGHVCGGGLAGPGNWEGVGLEGAYETYADAVGQALRAADLQARDLSAGGYALAGLDFGSDERQLRPVVERLGVPGPQVLVNDTYGALRAGTRQGYGVVIIAGTGTTVAGCNRRGERFRTFGEGQVLGDVGGAGDIVWLALRAVAQAYTGRGRPTAITDRFVRMRGLDDALQLIEGICRGTVEPPDAAHAPLIFEAAAEGDVVAQDIIRYTGHELGANAAAVARRLGMLGEPFDLVLAGGVFRSQSTLLLDAILDPLRAVACQVRPVPLRTAPAAGSVLLAMDADGQEVTPEVQERLAEQARQCLLGDAEGAV
jgi:N-acetylglucosamine kinase-like BadF-type ATPase